MYYLNLGLVIIILAGIFFEAYLIFKRNRTIKVKGNDDFFTVTLIIFFTMLIFPVNSATTLIESLRNVFFLLFIFVTFLIKRGISSRGIEKVLFTIAWDKIESIQIEESKLNYIVVRIKTKIIKFNLTFHSFQLPILLDAMGGKVTTVNIQKSLTKKIV